MKTLTLGAYTRVFTKVLCTSLLMLSASTGFAKDKVVYEHDTKLDFEVKAVDGQFLSPQGSAVKGDKALDFDSLLDPKQNFQKELNRDAGAVR